jgi:hypothetical protein
MRSATRWLSHSEAWVADEDEVVLLVVVPSGMLPRPEKGGGNGGTPGVKLVEELEEELEELLVAVPVWP